MVEISRGYRPGAIGRVTELHGIYYSKHWGFTSFFEAKVAGGLAAFMDRYDELRDGFWTAALGDRVEGSIAIDSIHAEQEGVHLRWFILSDALRGKGIGKQLINAALDFCRSKNYKRIYLWTFEGLHSARYLYEATGFKLVEQHRGSQWGKAVNEQKFELQLE